MAPVAEVAPAKLPHNKKQRIALERRAQAGGTALTPAKPKQHEPKAQSKSGIQFLGNFS